ncbi:MAG: hypothetical protein LBJ22_05205 [Synergistaceae bacterium]|jgi:activator of HSP90 ATPase|nr:hypothetical protein [Synergistaceae bacterium]
MSVNSVSGSGAILREEYLEQQRKLQRQKQQAGSDTTAQPAEASKSGGNADASSGNQRASQSTAPAAATSANAEATALTTSGSDTSSDQTLINKANSGAELSSSELSTLKEIDPALYARVMKAQKARTDESQNFTSKYDEVIISGR